MKYPKDLTGITSDGATVLSRDASTKLYQVLCGCGALFTCARGRITAVLGGTQRLRCQECWKSASGEHLRSLGNQFQQKPKKNVLSEAAGNELDALRRDAERYRVLREHGVRIEDGSSVQRAGGLDLWCDERLSATQEQSSKS